MNEAINQLYTGQKRLASRRTWIYLLVRLVRHCVSVQWLAITLVEIQFARKSTQGFHSLATKPKPTRVEWHPYIPCYSFTATYKALKYIPVFFFATCVYFRWNLQVRLVVQRKSLHKFHLRLLAATCGYLRVRLQSYINRTKFVTSACRHYKPSRYLAIMLSKTAGSAVHSRTKDPAQYYLLPTHLPVVVGFASDALTIKPFLSDKQDIILTQLARDS